MERDIGNEVYKDNYEFYIPPVSIKRYPTSDLMLGGLIEFDSVNGEFISDIELIEFTGTDYKPNSKLYIGSHTGKKKKKLIKTIGPLCND